MEEQENKEEQKQNTEEQVMQLKKATQALKEARLANEELLAKIEREKATAMLGGKSESNIPKKEESPEEYAKKVMGGEL